MDQLPHGLYRFSHFWFRKVCSISFSAVSKSSLKICSRSSQAAAMEAEYEAEEAGTVWTGEGLPCRKVNEGFGKQGTLEQTPKVVGFPYDKDPNKVPPISETPINAWLSWDVFRAG